MLFAFYFLFILRYDECNIEMNLKKSNTRNTKSKDSNDDGASGGDHYSDQIDGSDDASSGGDASNTNTRWLISSNKSQNYL